MYKETTPEEIAGIAMFNYIINQGLLEIILDKMHAINILESVSYKKINETQIEETYIRELYLRGIRIDVSIKKYTYNKDEKPNILLNKEENASIDDLKDFLTKADYKDLLVIAKEVGHQEMLRKEEITLKLN